MLLTKTVSFIRVRMLFRRQNNGRDRVTRCTPARKTNTTSHIFIYQGQRICVNERSLTEQPQRNKVFNNVKCMRYSYSASRYFQMRFEVYRLKILLLCAYRVCFIVFQASGSLESQLVSSPPFLKAPTSRFDSWGFRALHHAPRRMVLCSVCVGVACISCSQWTHEDYLKRNTIELVQGCFSQSDSSIATKSKMLHQSKTLSWTTKCGRGIVMLTTFRHYVHEGAW